MAMNGSLIPLRVTVLLLAIIIGILFLLGILFWNNTSYKCLDGKRPYGDFITVLAINKLELRVKQWGCDPANRYDPNQFKSLYSIPNAVQ